MGPRHGDGRYKVKAGEKDIEKGKGTTFVPNLPPLTIGHGLRCFLNLPKFPLLSDKKYL